MHCPKCNYENVESAIECQRCGVIFAKIKKPVKKQLPAKVEPATAEAQVSAASVIIVAVVAFTIAAGIYVWIRIEKSNLDAYATAPPPVLGRASASNMGERIDRQNSSYGLTYDDIAWHAVNSYGYDCPVITARQAMNEREGFYLITCESGDRLRVYPRDNQHPKITGQFGQ